jgi:hypothetical protein
MKGITFANKDLQEFQRLCRTLFPEFLSIELINYGGTIGLLFRKAAKNSLINIIAPNHVQVRIGLLDFLLMVLPKRLSQAKARNESFVPQYLIEIFAIMYSGKPEYLLRYYIDKFREIKDPLNEVSFEEIMDNIRESQIGVEMLKRQDTIGKLFNLNTEANSKEIKIIKILRSYLQ